LHPIITLIGRIHAHTADNDSHRKLRAPINEDTPGARAR
jgi:hypothetical protein